VIWAREATVAVEAARAAGMRVAEASAQEIAVARDSIVALVGDGKDLSHPI
jgi:3-hydroxyisobutyrate dehydrogenase-like beta-hydroxyacid dehydrogenase